MRLGLKFRRYFLPGLKRWISIGIISLVFISLGIALLLELRPISKIRDLALFSVSEFAKFVPNVVSGSIAITIGVSLLVYAIIRGNRAVVRAIAPEFGEGSVLEELQRVHSLSRGIKIVAVGGGTGLNTLLSGLKHYTTNITAIVTVADDGGSSGRLREELGIIPPGDIRNCIAALADDDKLITELFKYRFTSGQNLEGHSFGNLFLFALKEVMHGDFVQAIKAASFILKSRGVVLPSSPEPMKIIAELEDGRIIEGESKIPEAKGRIKRIYSEPKEPQVQKEAVEAILSAELIVLGPGSLYTSIIPNLLVPEINEAIKKSNAHKIYICNIMTQPGETSGYAVSDHIAALQQHSGNTRLIDGILVNDRHPEKLLAKYEEKGQEPVFIDADVVQKLGIRLIARSLIKEENLVRHDPNLLARAILLWHKRWQKYPVKKAAVLSTSYKSTLA